MKNQLTTDAADFNPHFHKGSDIQELLLLRLHWMISIHTSARKVTDAVFQTAGIIPISIHTSAREVTFSLPASHRLYKISIHTSAREVTGNGIQAIITFVISIHTSAREVTQYQADVR